MQNNILHSKRYIKTEKSYMKNEKFWTVFLNASNKDALGPATLELQSWELLYKLKLLLSITEVKLMAIFC